MAQAGFTPISLYYSTTAAATPSAGNLVAGELALNTVDEKLYFKNSAGTVKLLASNATSSPVLSFSAGTTGFTPNTATTGAVTLAGTLATTNGGTGLTSFTSGGVVYASSSSALATSSALTWDGSLFTVTHASGVDGRGIRLVNSSNSQTWETRIGVQSLENTAYAIKDITAGAVRLLIQAGTGSVGIGTNQPTSQLHVVTAGSSINWLQSSNVNGGYQEFNNGTAAVMYLGFGPTLITGIATTDAAIRYTNNLVFGNGGSEVARFISGGNLGLGTNSPNAKLDVATSSGSAGQVNTHIVLSRGTSTGAVLQTERAAASNNVSALIFNINSAERFRFSDAGQLGIAGANYGTAGQVLTSGGASAAPTWSTISAGGLTVIGTLTLSAGTQSGSINLPSGWDTTYKYLQLVIQGNYVSASGTGAGIIRFNNDTGSVYSYSWFNMTTGTNQSSQTFIQFGSPGNNEPMRCSFQLSYNANMSSAYRVQLQGGFSRNNVFYSAGFAYDTSSVPTSINFPQPFGSGYYLAGVYTVYGVS